MDSLKKYTWQSIARDFNSPFIRNYIWTHCLSKYEELLDIKLPQLMIGIVSRKDDIEYIADMDTWSKTHEVLKLAAEDDPGFVERFIDQTNILGESFNLWTESNILNADVEVLSNNDLLTLLKCFIEKQSELYALGILLPILDFQGFSFVENNVRRFLKEKVSESDFQTYFNTFTSPIKNSFAQDQEEDLLRIMSKFNKGTFLNDLKNKSIDEVKTLHSDFYIALQEHTSKHAWVYYVYAGPAFTEKDFYGFIINSIEKGVDPDQRLKELEDQKTKLHITREEYIKALQPEAFDESILRLAGKMVWAKPRRKDYQSKSYYHLEKLQREMAKRLYVSLSQVRSTPLEILEKSLKDGELDVSIPNSIYRLHVCLPDNDSVILLCDDSAKEFYDKSVQKEEEIDMGGIKEFKGSVAFAGKARGIVKVINKSEDISKINDGDILVSIATTPSIVPAMKKAAAIVTDEGGLTCHAAIVSRELGITCIIGTKIATKVLKDGDIVEVDANSGIVKIL